MYLREESVKFTSFFGFLACDWVDTLIVVFVFVGDQLLFACRSLDYSMHLLHRRRLKNSRMCKCRLLTVAVSYWYMVGVFDNL